MEFGALIFVSMGLDWPWDIVGSWYMFIEAKELLFPSSIWGVCQVHNNSPFSGNSELALAVSSLNSCPHPPPAIVHGPRSNAWPQLAKYPSLRFGIETLGDWRSVSVAKPRAYKYRGCYRAILQIEGWRKLDWRARRLKPPYREEQTEYGEKFWRDLDCL